MRVEQLRVPGAYAVTPKVLEDVRGTFFEWFKAPVFRDAVGHDLALAQGNCSVSSAGTLRGVHFCDVPPGQAKYVMCLSGAVLDAVVDLRVGSPTFGQWDTVRLDTQTRRAVFLSEGLGHGFVALEDASTVLYLCSTTYNPTAEHGVDPFDEDLGIDWGLSEHEAILSAKDMAAPSLKEALEEGILPDYEGCQQWYCAKT